MIPIPMVHPLRKITKAIPNRPWGWSGGAYVLVNFPVPGRPTNWDFSRARVGCFGLNGPLRQHLSLYRAVSQREGEKRREKDRLE